MGAQAKPQVLMFGTSPTGKGGVASVVTVLESEGFFEQHEVRYITTHVEHSRTAKLTAFLNALCQLLVAARLRPLVHVHSASRASFFRKSILLAIARLFGCPTIFHLHGAEFQKFSTKEAGPLLRWWIRRTLESSSLVIALSDTWAKFLSDYAPRANVAVVPNSVALPLLPAESREVPGRVLFLGRADRRKGIFELLDALAILAPDFPDLILIAGGDGDLDAVRGHAAALGISERVNLLGWIGAEQKRDELERAAIFTLPSHDEGLPMAMLEAMAASKAIIVTPVGGIPQAVTDGVNGILTPAGAAPLLAAALRRLLSDCDLRERLARAARKTIADRFSTEVVLARLSIIYFKLGVESRTNKG